MDILLQFVGQYGPPGLIAIFVLLVFTGRLVPLALVRLQMQTKDDIIETQRNTIDKQGSTIEQIAQNTGELLEVSKTTEHALQSIRQAGEDAKK